MSQPMNKQNRRAKASRKGAAERKAAERRTLENKARKMLRALKANPNDSQTADALVSLCDLHPWVRNLKV